MLINESAALVGGFGSLAYRATRWKVKIKAENIRNIQLLDLEILFFPNMWETRITKNIMKYLLKCLFDYILVLGSLIFLATLIESRTRAYSWFSKSVPLLYNWLLARNGKSKIRTITESLKTIFDVYKLRPSCPNVSVSTERAFLANGGTPQGDSLRPALFILNVEHALSHIRYIVPNWNQNSKSI